MILEYLNMATDYIKPTRLVEELEETLEKTGKGIISIFMERGTGKSAFANQMSGLYHKKSLIPGTFSRCIHVQNISMRGISDFINSVNFGFRHSFDPANDLYGSKDVLPSLELDTKTPQKDMADFLNYYHERYQQEYTILVIDGIDEINTETEKMIDFVPSSEQLEEGVFVILLSRFKDEKTIRGHCRKYIETAEAISNKCIQVRRKEAFNTDVLNEYIDDQINQGLISENIDRGALLSKADYRFLYLKAYFSITHDVLFDNTDETHFIADYMIHLLSFYGPIQADQLKEFAVSVALCPELTIHKYCDLISCAVFTCEIAGLINGLLPLMSVYRIDDENVIQFADEAYSEFVLREYQDIAHETVKKINQLFVTFKQTVMEGNDSLGNILVREFTPAEMRTLLFIGESVYNICRLSLDYEDNQLFFEFTEIFDLVWMLKWSRGLYGYEQWLGTELTKYLAKGLQCCARYERTKLSENWLHIISTEACSDRLNIQKMIIKDSVRKDEHLNALCAWLKINTKQADDLSDWLWLFENNLSADVMELLVSTEERMDHFISHMRKNGLPHMGTELFNNINSYNLSIQLKEKLANLRLALLLPHELRAINYDDREDIQNCLQKMEEMGYQLDLDSFNDADRLILEQIEEADLNEVIYQTLGERTIEILNDRKNGWDNDQKKAEALREMLRYVYDCSVFDPHVSGIIKEFSQALYERILFEDSMGTLPQFVQSVKASDESFIKMIVYISDANSIIDHSSSLSQIAHKYACQGYSYFMRLAANLKIVSMVTANGGTELGSALLEELITCDDTPAYIATLCKEERSDTLVQLMKEPDHLVFCTPNILVLLNKYRKEEKTKKLKQLCMQIDKSVPQIIDRYLYASEVRAEAEIMVFRYCRLRERNSADDSFDQYVSALIQYHTDAIADFRNNISRDSNFRQLLLHIEIILEYYWLNKEWKAGVEKCRQLHEILEVNNTNDLHTTLVESIRDHISLVDTVKNMLLYFCGEPYDETEVSKLRFAGFGMPSRMVSNGIIVQTHIFATGGKPIADDFMPEEKQPVMFYVGH